MFCETVEVGSSVAYIWNDYNKPAREFLYSELTWNINAKMKLNKRSWMGAQVAPVFAWTRDMDQITTAFYHFQGLTAQFDVVSKRKYQFYVDALFNRSNLLILEAFNTK